MTEQLLTKCPHCSTTFRLSPTQLETAQGAVRCGACLQVFHASDYLTDPNEEPALSEPDHDNSGENDQNSDKPYDPPGLGSGSFSSSISTESQPFSFGGPQTEEAEDIYGYSEPKLGQGTEETDEAWAEALLKELDDEEPTAASAPVLNTSTQASPPQPSATATKAIDFSEQLPDNSTNNVAAPSEEHDPSAQFSGPSSGSLIDESELSDTFKDLESFHEDSYDNPFTEELSTTSSPTTDAADESWAQSMLSDLEDENAAIDHKSMSLEKETSDDPGLFGLGYKPNEATDEVKKEAKANIRSKLDQDIEDFFSEGNDDTLAPNLPLSGDQLQADKENKLNFTDNDLTNQIKSAGNIGADDFINNFADEDIPNLLTNHDQNESAQDYLSNMQTGTADISMPITEPTGNLSRLSLGIILNLAALLILVAQYAYYNFDTLARQDSYRPLYAKVCGITGCKLPSINDANRIKSTNLIVRAHPIETNALVVDAIIYNRAVFEQPFPILQLSFSDLNGALIAERDFTPDEYRRGQLLHMKMMPPNTPIHLSLEIIDPGPKAVEYQLKFRYPSQRNQS